MIAYYDATLGALKLAERIQNVWHTQFIAPVEGGFHWVALGLDLVGTIHVVYAPQIGVRHYQRVGGYWMQDTITVQSGLASWDGAFTIDAEGGLHTSFFLYPTGVHYAYKTDGAWGVEGVYTVALSGGQYSSVAVLPDGTPVVCFRKTRLCVYRRSEGSWVEDQSVPSTLDPSSTSMLVAQDGYPRIAFAHSGGLSLASMSPQGWNISPVSEMPGSRRVSLAHDGQGRSLIAFISGNNASVLLAYGGPNSWELQPVDSVPGGVVTSASCSMALDHQGFPRVAFHTGQAGGDLRFVEGPAGVSVPEGRATSGFSLGPPRPNPTESAGLVLIDCLSPAAEEAQLVLYDLLGRELYRASKRLQPGRTILSLMIPKVAPGLIVAALRRSNGRLLATRGIVVLH